MNLLRASDLFTYVDSYTQTDEPNFRISYKKIKNSILNIMPVMQACRKIIPKPYGPNPIYDVCRTIWDMK